MHTESEKVVGLVEHLFRRQAGRMVSTLTRIFGPKHLDLAEEVVQDALMKALQCWPYQGTPANPTAWLIQAAKNRALDLLRRETLLQSKADDIIAAFTPNEGSFNRPTGFSPLEALDDQLGMIFMACHPSLPRESRVALTLKTVGGFGVGEIARAFLAKEPTIAQRLVRAKRQIRDEGVLFELPEPTEMSGRLDSVLEVVYLLFNEGYTAHQGDSLVRFDLCEEAVRLGTLLTEHPTTDLPKCHALLSLMLLQAARLPARTSANGDMHVLGEQDRSLWNKRLIHRGLVHLDRCAEGDEPSEYHLQAAIAAVHAIAPSYRETDWKRIVGLYDQLAAMNPSPVVLLNRAVAVAKAFGPEAGLGALEEIGSHPTLAHYYLLPATLGDLFKELGETDKAAGCYRQALDRSCSEPERRFLQGRLKSVS